MIPREDSPPVAGFEVEEGEEEYRSLWRLEEAMEQSGQGLPEVPADTLVLAKSVVFWTLDCGPPGL